MSAENWDICPSCLKKATKDRADKVQAVTDAYGKVPADEYELMRADVAASALFGEKEDEHTLREDYELGIFHDEDTFYVEYSGKCTVCDFSKTFKHSEKLAP